MRFHRGLVKTAVMNRRAHNICCRRLKFTVCLKGFISGQKESGAVILGEGRAMIRCRREKSDDE